MGANNKNYQDHQRTFINTSPSNKKYSSSSSSQRPSPSKSITIKTPNKNGHARNYFNSSNNGSAVRLSQSGSPTSPFFAASKCFESPSPDSLPLPPKNWIPMTVSNNSTSTISSTTTTSTTNPQANRVRKALILPMDNNKDIMSKNSCAMAAFSTYDMTNDHFTQNLKLMLNVNA